MFSANRLKMQSELIFLILFIIVINSIDGNPVLQQSTINGAQSVVAVASGVAVGSLKGAPGLAQVTPPEEEKKCERITTRMCTDLRYNYTMMPNFMGHNNQREASLGLVNYEPFLNHECSPYLRLFICSAFVPLCSEHAPVPIQACKGLCERVKKDCLSSLQALSFQWPEELNCSKFPQPPELCIQQPMEENEASHFVNTEDDLKNQNCPMGMKYNGERCIALCKYMKKYQGKKVTTFEIWVAFWSSISMIFTIFSMITFFIQPKRFRWPARPILYLTISGFVTSTIYLIRWLEGPYTCSEDNMENPSESLSCVGISLILLFCDVAYSLWFFIFCFVWFLSAMKEWSTEAIEKLSTRLHTSVWILTAIPMIYILFSNNININYVSGFCEVQNPVLILFQLLFLLISLILSVLTTFALQDVKRTLKNAGRSPLKLERLFYRLLILSLGIAVPHFLYLVCHFYNGFLYALLKLVFRNISVIFATLWVFSPKTFQVWGQLICCCCRRKKDTETAKQSKKERRWLCFGVKDNSNSGGNNNNGKLTKLCNSNAPLMPVTKV